ncbi:MAG: hypothetical protein ABI367_05215 [Mucilaginibacter sp.]
MKNHLALLTLIAAFALQSCKKGDGSGTSSSSQSPATPAVTLPSVGFFVKDTFTYPADIYVVAHDSIGYNINVFSDGGAPVTARGACWSTFPNPTIADKRNLDGAGTANIHSGIGGLTVNTKYYLRAYATNSAGTAYGSQITLTTAYVKGERFGGGIIISIDQTGLHGLIATEFAKSAVVWGTGTGNAYSASDGAGNTDKIIQALGPNSVNAAAICRACRDGGFSDWFLPALNQLTLIGIPANGASYWSSTEISTNPAIVYITASPYGSSYAEPKTVKHELLPMRAF